MIDAFEEPSIEELCAPPPLPAPGEREAEPEPRAKPKRGRPKTGWREAMPGVDIAGDWSKEFDDE